jgi:hypothetical protein
VFLLMVMVYTAPRDLLHIFADHADTVHASCQQGDEPVISTVHHHCDLLHFTIEPAMLTEAQVWYVPVEAPVLQNEFPVKTFHTLPRPALSLRGPPAVA